MDFDILTGPSSCLPRLPRGLVETQPILTRTLKLILLGFYCLYMLLLKTRQISIRQYIVS